MEFQGFPDTPHAEFVLLYEQEHLNNESIDGEGSLFWNRGGREQKRLMGFPGQPEQGGSAAGAGTHNQGSPSADRSGVRRVRGSVGLPM